MAPPIPPEAAKEIDYIKGLVARHFPVYDVRVSFDVVQYFCRADPTTLEGNFEEMRLEMNQLGYIPMITYEKGEYIVAIARRPATRYRGIYFNLALLIATTVSTLIAGLLQWASYDDVPSDEIWTLNTLAMGALTFTLPLMGMLAIHELGHFFMARRRKVAASLPFFIPSIPPLGTFGAFISLRDPIPNRKSLLDIGVAGPFTGLVVAVAMAVLGLYLTNLGAKPLPQNIGSEGVVSVSLPIIMTALEMLVPIEGDYLLHPTAFAAWVGILVTALNLLPVGQLDGGHLGRAILGARAKYLSWAVVAMLIGIGIYYLGWLLFAMLVLFLGAKHPPPLNDITPLDAKRKGVAIAAFVVLAVSFIPVPMTAVAADFSFELEPITEVNATIAPGGSQEFIIVVNNTGNVLNEISLSNLSWPANWTAEFKRADQDQSRYAEELVVLLNSSETYVVNVRITASAFATTGDNYTVTIIGSAVNSSEERMLQFTLTAGTPTLTLSLSADQLTIPRTGNASVTILLDNAGLADVNLTLKSLFPSDIFARITPTEAFDSDSTSELNVTVPAGAQMTATLWIFVPDFSQLGDKAVSVYAFYGTMMVCSADASVTVTSG
ncbi:MAG TPA: site-2 protease family protein [Thermoplasmata archaeon]